MKDGTLVLGGHRCGVCDGRVMVMRNQLGTLHHSESTDDGVHWSEPKSTGLTSPESCPELTRIPSKDDGETWSQGLVLDERVGCSYPDVQQLPTAPYSMCWNFMRSRGQEIRMTTFREEDALAANAKATARVKSHRKLVTQGGTPSR